jgi:hypothetical protein
MSEDLQLKIKLLSQGFDQFKKDLDKINSGLGESRSAGEKFSRVDFTQLFAALALLNQGITAIKTGLGAGYGLLVRQNLELQDQQTQTAAALSATLLVSEAVTGKQLQGEEKLKVLRGLAAKQQLDLQKASLDIVGVTSQELQGVLATVNLNTSATGNSLAQNVKLATSFAAALGVAKIPLEQQRQEIQSILTGQITNDSVLAQQLGITNALVQQKREEGKLQDYLLQKMEAAVEANKLQSATIAGYGSNLQELFDQFGRISGEDITQTITEKLGQLYDGVTKFQDQFGKLAGDLGPEFGALADMTLGPIVNGLIEVATWIAGHEPEILGFFDKLGGYVAAGSDLAGQALGSLQFTFDGLGQSVVQFAKEFLNSNEVLKTVTNGSIVVFNSFSAVINTFAAVLAIATTGWREFLVAIDADLSFEDKRAKILELNDSLTEFTENIHRKNDELLAGIGDALKGDDKFVEGLRATLARGQKAYEEFLEKQKDAKRKRDAELLAAQTDYTTKAVKSPEQLAQEIDQRLKKEKEALKLQTDNNGLELQALQNRQKIGETVLKATEAEAKVKLQILDGEHKTAEAAKVRQDLLVAQTKQLLEQAVLSAKIADLESRKQELDLRGKLSAGQGEIDKLKAQTSLSPEDKVKVAALQQQQTLLAEQLDLTGQLRVANQRLSDQSQSDLERQQLLAATTLDQQKAVLVEIVAQEQAQGKSKAQVDKTIDSLSRWYELQRTVTATGTAGQQQLAAAVEGTTRQVVEQVNALDQAKAALEQYASGLQGVQVSDANGPRTISGRGITGGYTGEFGGKRYEGLTGDQYNKLRELEDQQRDAQNEQDNKDREAKAQAAVELYKQQQAEMLAAQQKSNDAAQKLPPTLDEAAASAKTTKNELGGVAGSLQAAGQFAGALLAQLEAVEKQAYNTAAAVAAVGGGPKSISPGGGAYSPSESDFGAAGDFIGRAIGGAVGGGFADGGIQPAVPGGVLRRFGEGGSPEAAIPLNLAGASFIKSTFGPLLNGVPVPSSGGGTTVSLDQGAVVQAVRDLQRSLLQGGGLRQNTGGFDSGSLPRDFFGGIS